MSRMIVQFGGIAQDIAVPAGVPELLTAVAERIPGLAPHMSAVQLRYVDDEGDEILVTTTDELQEGIRVGKMTAGGTLVLMLVLPNIDASAQAKIEASVVVPPIVPLTPPQPPQRTADVATDVSTDVSATDTSVTDALATGADVLATLRNAGEKALQDLNAGLGIAQTEITRLYRELKTATTTQTRTRDELDAARAQLASVEMQSTAFAEESALLKERLTASSHALAEELKVKAEQEARIAALEQDAAASAHWQEKYQRAEQERIRLQEQLGALRLGLAALAGEGAGKEAVASVLPSCDEDCDEPSFSFDREVNFIEGARYNQLDLPKDLPEREDAELAWIKERAGADCAGFFFQQHRNGHRIVGYYSSAEAMGGKRARHGHRRGFVATRVSGF